jgi:competence protein ComEA
VSLAVVLFLFSSAGVFGEGLGQKTKVNINTASVSELETLPQIGPKVAQRIVDFRTQNGKFKKIEELMKIKGIGEKTFDKLKDLITVGSEGKGK